MEAGTIDHSRYDTINALRNKKADMMLPAIPSGLSQGQLRAAVRKERTVELAFEGLPLQDIRRWKTAATVLPGPVYRLTYIENGTTKVVQLAVNRLFDALKHYLWPVLQTERDQNSNLEQNPGW